jgi:uncharacterized phosphatase
MGNNFYFIRHGQTELNAKNDLHSNEDVPLNDTGRRQAERAKTIIEKLPIATICVSPLKRTLETALIVAGNLKQPKVVVQDLRECNGVEWLSMLEWEEKSFSVPLLDQAKSFMDRALKGINESLKHPGPVLIVAHGGIHWALCHHFNIQDHNRIIDNCVPLHVEQVHGKWKVKVL